MRPRIYNGVDLVRVSRLRELDAAIRARFYERVFTEGEREHIGDNFARAAGVFAAKEAAAKALGTGIMGVSWQDIEVWHDKRGQPHMTLRGKAEEQAQALGILDMAVSITDEREYAAAVVSALGEEAD